MRISLIIIFLLSLSVSSSYDRISEIFIEKHEVFERTDKDWFFLAPVLNYIHYETRDYIIEDEILFYPGDELNEDAFLETERNLRSTGLFTEATVKLDSIGDGLYDAYVITKDRWSTYPSIVLGIGGGVSQYGTGIEEYNLLGTGTYISAEGFYRTENDIGLQGEFELSQRRLFRSEIAFRGFLQANRLRTTQELSFIKPFRTLDTKRSFGLMGTNTFGSDFIYPSKDSALLLNIKELRTQMWYSVSYWRNDRVFATAYLELEDVNRGDPLFKRAYDNSGVFLLDFSSVAQDFYTVEKMNNYHLEDMKVGGYGSATLGRLFSLGNGGETLWYVAGQGEQSYYNGNVYLYGRVKGGSAFTDNTAKYTYQEFYGLGTVRLNKSNLFTYRVYQQTVWNWPEYRQLVLDVESGLRGYDANFKAGENRLISNLEFRTFPNINLWIFDLSGVMFWDAGSVWSQTEQILDSRFYSSVGAGLRFHFTKSASTDHIFRLDFAYNLETESVGFVFTTRQLFSSFMNHEFRLPELLGNVFDFE